MKKLAYVAIAAMGFFAAACDGDTVLDTTIDVGSGEPVALELSTDPSGDLNYYGDTSLVVTNVDHLCIDSIIINRVEGEGVIPRSYTYGIDLRDGAGLVCEEWLSVDFNDSTLRVVTIASKLPQSELVYEIYVSYDGDQSRVLHGFHGLMLGPGPDYDPIKVDSNVIEAGAEGGSFTITTADNGWWVCSMTADGNTYEPKYVTLADARKFAHTMDWLSVKRDGTTLHIDVAPNGSGRLRTFEIMLEHGNSFSRIVGTQRAAAE